MGDPVQTEWRRPLARLRRKGPIETVEYVSGLIRGGRYPAWYPYRLANYLMRNGQFSAAGKLLKTARRYGQAHPLIDQLYGTWLWCNGDRKAATKFTARKARFWSKSFLYNLLAGMYALEQSEGKARSCDRLAASLAEEELARRPPSK